MSKSTGISSNKETVLRTLGVLGGGQLGRMMADAAHRLGVKIVVLDPTPNSPAGQGKKESIAKKYISIIYIYNIRIVSI